jgi:uncharacterized protein
MMKIPYEQLKTETLYALIEEFVSREGTEYGEYDIPMDEKVEQVLTQLKDGKVHIVFDDKSNSCNIIQS